MRPLATRFRRLVSALHDWSRFRLLRNLPLDIDSALRVNIRTGMPGANPHGKTRREPLLSVAIKGKIERQILRIYSDNTPAALPDRDE